MAEAGGLLSGVLPRKSPIRRASEGLPARRGWFRPGCLLNTRHLTRSESPRRCLERGEKLFPTDRGVRRRRIGTIQSARWASESGSRSIRGRGVGRLGAEDQPPKENSMSETPAPPEEASSGGAGVSDMEFSFGGWSSAPSRPTPRPRIERDPLSLAHRADWIVPMRLRRTPRSVGKSFSPRSRHRRGDSERVRWRVFSRHPGRNHPRRAGSPSDARRIGDFRGRTPLRRPPASATTIRQVTEIVAEIIILDRLWR